MNYFRGCSDKIRIYDGILSFASFDKVSEEFNRF